MTLKLIRIGRNRAGDCRRAHRFRAATLLFLKDNLGIHFQATVFGRLAKVIAEDALENALDGNIIREQTDRKTDDNKELGWETNWKNEHLKRKHR